MRKRSRFRTSLMMFFSLLFASALLVACDAGEEEAGGGGLTDETPVIDVTDVVDEPGVEPTMVPEATEELAVTPEVTEEMTATAEVVEPTEQPEDQDDADTDDQTGVDADMMVAQASTLMGMTIEDGSGQEVGFVRDILVDDSGAFQYVIVEALDTTVMNDDAATTDDSAATGAEATAENATATADNMAQDDATDPMVSTTVALPWDTIEVVSSTATDDMDAGDAEDTDDELFDDDEDEDLLNLVYSGGVTLEEQQSFDALILDEQGAVLDGEAAEADDVTIPSEFANLIQLSEYDDLNLFDANGEDIGEIEDALADVNEGRVLYVIADFGGFLGLGEKTVAIPWSEIQMQVTAEDGAESESFTLDADQQRLEDAPVIDLDNWIPDVNVDWDTEFREFWETEIEADNS